MGASQDSFISSCPSATAFAFGCNYGHTAHSRRVVVVSTAAHGEHYCCARCCKAWNRRLDTPRDKQEYIGACGTRISLMSEICPRTTARAQTKCRTSAMERFIYRLRKWIDLTYVGISEWRAISRYHFSCIVSATQQQASIHSEASCQRSSHHP